MNTTIGGHNFRAMVAVVFAVQTAAKTSGGNPAMRARSAGGSSITEDPYIDRHAEVVARYHEGSLR